MRRFAIALATLAALSGAALAYDAASQAVIDRFKPGKLVPIETVGALMLGAERWCYEQKGNECGWSDIYLGIDGDRVRYELSNPWSAAVDISFIAEGIFRDGRYICDTGFDWVPSVRAYERPDGQAIEGRELDALKQEIAAHIDTSQSKDCFDYLYEGHDAEAQTISLTQRQYVDDAHQPARDAEVTLHFDKANADDLGWYW